MKGGYIILELDRKIPVELNLDTGAFFGYIDIEYGEQLYNKIYGTLNSGKPILINGAQIFNHDAGLLLPITGYAVTAGEGLETVASISLTFTLDEGQISVIFTIQLYNYGIDVAFSHYRISATVALIA